MITQSRLFRWLRWQWRMLLVNLAYFNQSHNPYARVAELQRSVIWLVESLCHASCTCGKPLEWGSAYGHIHCEHCHHLATADLHHRCDVYLGNGCYWCRACVISAVEFYDLLPSAEKYAYDEDDILAWVELLPEGALLARVQHAQQQTIAIQPC